LVNGPAPRAKLPFLPRFVRETGRIRASKTTVNYNSKSRINPATVHSAARPARATAKNARDINALMGH
jgi:ribosomal protein S18